MRRDARVWITDAITAGERIAAFMGDKDASTYAADPMLHSAVERQFEIIGEALRQLATHDPDTASSVSSFRRIVAFRNQLAHGYFAVQHSVVWAVAKRDVPAMVEELRAILVTLPSESME